MEFDLEGGIWHGPIHPVALVGFYGVAFLACAIGQRWYYGSAGVRKDLGRILIGSSSVCVVLQVLGLHRNGISGLDLAGWQLVLIPAVAAVAFFVLLRARSRRLLVVHLSAEEGVSSNAQAG